MKRHTRIIVSVILLVAMMSQIPLQTSAQMSAEQGETGEIIIFTEASPLREPVYISIGFLAGLWYLNAIYFIRLTPLYKLMKNTIDDFYSSSDPIDVNYNESKFRMIIFNMIW